MKTYAFYDITLDRFTTNIERLLTIRRAPDEKEKIKLAIGYLDSGDLTLMEASIHYLELLVDKTEKESVDWVLKPPSNRDWSYRDYLKRNVLAKRKIWKQWWDKHPGS